jgi:aminoglycoside 2'-N-acetyltransferase I
VVIPADHRRGSREAAPEESNLIRTLPTADLTPTEMLAIRELLENAFAGEDETFTAADWEHTLHGVHAVAEVDGRIVAQAAVVRRLLEADGRLLSTGYVEGVATAPELQGRGYGSAIMHAVDEVIRRGFELGALSTGLHAFYARLGWERWQGQTGVRTQTGLVLTPDDDDGIMILRTPSTPKLDRAATLTCDWREGDVW